jgi:hypothetical protein
VGGAGGAVHDALVPATAREAAGTYDLVGVD